MSNPSETFGFAYQLTKSGGIYTVVDGDGTTPKIDPLDTQVDIVDPNGDSTLGGSEKLRVHDTKSDVLATGKYTYVGTADLGTGSGSSTSLPSIGIT